MTKKLQEPTRITLLCYRSEAAVKKADDARKSREVAQLKKETRKKEHRIKSLEADAKRREVVLRRRAEEVRRRGGKEGKGVASYPGHVGGERCSLDTRLGKWGGGR